MFALLTFLLPHVASAAQVPTLDDYLAQTVTSADSAFEQAMQKNAGENSNDPAESGLIYKQFFLGLVPNATFGVSKVLNVQVSPEITFIWEKTDRN